VAYLNPVKKRPNLQIITHAQVEKVEISEGRATGVVYTDRSGTRQTVSANREIVLSGGAINSPQILMLSGVGEAAQLSEHGIEVKKDAQGVGKNMQDHLQARAEIPDVPRRAHDHGRQSGHRFHENPR